MPSEKGKTTGGKTTGATIVMGLIESFNTVPLSNRLE
jgi:hypothetical protein